MLIGISGIDSFGSETFSGINSEFASDFDQSISFATDGFGNGECTDGVDGLIDQGNVPDIGLGNSDIDAIGTGTPIINGAADQPIENGSFNVGQTPIQLSGFSDEEAQRIQGIMTGLYESSPEFQQAIDSKANGISMDQQDLGGGIYGRATVGGNEITLTPLTMGSDQELADTIVHELGHNVGFGHGPDHDAWIAGILQSGGANIA